MHVVHRIKKFLMLSGQESAAMQETQWVQWEDPPEKAMTAHSSILS